MDYYHQLRKYFALTSLLAFFGSLLINAPFGRFTPKNQTSPFLINGKIAWIVMESFAPLSFLYFSNRLSLLPLLYLIHYLNRAFVSPLRTPSRSKSHIIVPLTAIAFNIVNAYLLATFFNSSPTRPHLQFYTGVFLWFIGFAGNIWHDEVLLNLRRNTKPNNNKSEYYGIPHGGLYSFISFPNYLCEWLEWFGFALAASPLPFLSIAANGIWAPSLTPPWLFLISEILAMLPRAYRGHQWYKHKFGPKYPNDRKAIIPFLL